MISVMYVRHLIDFMRPVAELLAGALVVWSFSADAPKERKAKVAAAGRVEFALNRRATAAWLMLAVFFVYLVPVQFRHAANRPFSIA